jgi:hypothetical protein
MKDLVPPHHFLGVSKQHQADGLFLTQCQFALNICSHMKRTRTGSSSSNQGKPESLVWQTGQSSFVRTNNSQGHRRASMREPLLWSSDVWSVKELEPCQSKGLKQWMLDLIKEKQKEQKN